MIGWLYTLAINTGSSCLLVGTLQLCEATKALICECNTEQMHHIISELYAAQDISEEFVKKSIAGIKKETARVIGFGISRD